MTVMTDTQKVVLEVKAIDAEGHDTDLPNDTAWSVDNEDVITLEVDPTNVGRVTAYAGAPGIATVSITGGGLQGAEAFTVTPGPAAAFVPVVGTSEEGQPTPPSGGGETPPAEGGGDTPPVETGGDDGSGTPSPEEGGPDTGTDTPPVETGGDEPVIGEPGAETPVPADPTPVGENGSGTGLETGSDGSGSAGDDQPLPPVS
jgi:hypothetical protein